MSNYYPILSARILDSGNLLITADNAARRWLTEERHRGEDDLLWDGFEGYWTNGRYWPFDAGRANPFVGLWSGPCIAEAMHVDDDGKHTIVGRFWAQLDYCTVSAIDRLRTKGSVVFHLVS